MYTVHRKSLILFILTMVIFYGPGLKTASAQYFGQNKIQYEDFNFKILQTKHFDIYYYDEEKPAIKYVAKMAERWYDRHSKIFGFGLSGRQPIILYASHPQFQQTNTIPGDIGEGTGGVTEPLKRRIVLPLAGPLAETDHVIGHELVHAFQFDTTGHRGGESAFRNPGLQSLPLWFVEGMAEYLSIGYIDPNTAMWMRDAVKNRKELPSISQLNNPEYFPYRWGQSLLAYIAGRWGNDKIGKLLVDSGGKGKLDMAIKKELKTTPDSLSRRWHADMYSAYYHFSKTEKNSSDYGKLLISEKKGSGKYNIGPMLSPDGNSLIFFSEKDLFSIDLFLADAKTGKIKKNIVRAELDPHIESLQFIYSAGTWSPDNSQIAYATIEKGRPALNILDLKEDEITNDIPFPELGEILNPAWSPDGKYIVFSAITGGLSDLFLYDLRAQKLTRLTNDAYADIEPAWSPDGTQFVFVTDRFTTNLKNLDIGDYQLAIYNMSAKKIEPLECFDKGKNINPQWSKDGQQIYFISDQNGISNIYRKDLSNNTIYQITDLYTGVSAITPTSPALSVASQTNKMAYCVYEKGNYNIYVIDSLDSKKGFQVSPKVAEIKPYTEVNNYVLQTNPAILCPAKRVDDKLVKNLADPNMGLSNADSLVHKEYKTKFSLDYVGQPYVIAGVDRYGTQLGGGIGLYWSDMLGNNNLVTLAQIQYDAGFTDFTGVLGYQNNVHRWNWGATIAQIPYTLNQYVAGYGAQDSAIVYQEEQLRFQQLNRSITGFIMYPFSRATRVEFSGGLSHISFDEELRTRTYDPYTGNLISNKTEKLPVPGSLTLVNADAAFVVDNSIYGATSPIVGYRSRIEVSPYTGTISMFTVLGDYRQYFLPIKPITLAFRVMHYGRYGSGAEDSRLTPLFIGYQNFVRGYDSNSFSSSEGSVFNRLWGSKMAVANAELRFPLLGLFDLGHGYYGYLPLETGFFYDTGVTWNNNTRPSKPVRSYGILARFNLFGAAVIEVDYVKPVDRPQQGWYWQFNLSPGF